MGLLALVAGQDVQPGDTGGTWRIAQRVAPDRMISVVDPKSRHMHKSRSEYRDGYKAHIVVEPETGLITAVEVTAANAADGSTGVSLMSDEGAGLTLLADSGYGSGETRIALSQAGHHLAIKPIPARSAVPGGFNRDDFIVDHQAMTATCPAGHTVNITPTQRPSSEGFVAAAHLRSAVPNRSGGGRWGCTNTMLRCLKPAGRGVTVTSQPTTGAGVPWWSAP